MIRYKRGLIMCISESTILFAVVGGISGLIWGDDGVFYACCGCFLWGYFGG